MEMTVKKQKETFGVSLVDSIETFLGSKEADVPEIDTNYVFNKDVTKDILIGFQHNQRVYVQGYHGTGKSTHIEQVASRLGWKTLRVNLDGHISRSDLLGKDVITLRDGKQVTEFSYGLLPKAMKEGYALIFDEYDAARPDVLFVIQRLLETNGKLTLTDTNEVITPHENFRIFATANTLGRGDDSGLYQGTGVLNSAQLDRWSIFSILGYMDKEDEEKVLVQTANITEEKASSYVKVANLIRKLFIDDKISSVMSPRSAIAWAELSKVYESDEKAFSATFSNKCDDDETVLVEEAYHCVFGEQASDADFEATDTVFTYHD